MGDLLRDIEVLEGLLIAMREGASDEKRMALSAVENLIAQKQKIVDDFEKEFAQEMEDDSQEAIAA